MTLDINHMTQFDPPGGSNDLDMQLQLTADEISAWTVQNPNLDLSVYHQHSFTVSKSPEPDSGKLTSKRSSLSDAAKITHIQSYLTYFHPSLPIIHPASLNSHSTPPILLKAVVAIGCMYSASRAQPQDVLQSNANRELGQELWRSGCFELESFVRRYQGSNCKKCKLIFLIQVEKHRPRMRTSWVLQSWALFIAYGTFTGDEKCISKSRNMFRFVVDVRKKKSNTLFLHHP